MAAAATAADRVIAHFDIDCFYAQSEELRCPSLRGRPVGVTQKFLVVTCNYVAREMGVPKMVQISEAKKILPCLVLVNGEDLTPYRAESKQIMAVLRRFGAVQRSGLDEGAVDISAQVEARLRSGPPSLFFSGHVVGLEAAMIGDGKLSEGTFVNLETMNLRHDAISRGDMALLVGSQIVSEMRAAIKRETGFHCSCGVAQNKMLAKLASSLNKPNLQTCLLGGAVTSFLAPLKVQKIPGVGRHIQSVLSEMGVETISDLKTVSLKQISGRLGDRIGLFLFNSSRGEDPSPVQDKGPPKSLSVEDSFRNCQTLKQAEGILRMLAPDLIKRLDEDREETRRRPKTFTLKWRVHGTNWNFISVSTEMPFELLSASLAIEKRASAAVDLAVKLLSRSAGQTFHLVVLNIGATNFVSDSTASSPGVCDIRSFLQGQGKSLGKEMKFVSKSEARVRRESFRAMATEVPSPTSQHLMSRATRLLELNHGPGALREKLSDSHGFCDELLMDSDSSGSDEEEDLAHQLSSTIRPYCSSAGVGKNSMSHDGVSHTSNHEHVQLLRTKSPGKNTSLSSNFAMGSVLFDPPSVVGTNQFAEVGQIVREARPDHEPLCSSRELEYFENVPNVPQECLRHMPAISANLLAHEMGGTNATSNWSTNGDQGRVQASPTIPCHRSEPAERTTDSAAHDNMDGKPSCSSPCEIRNLGGDGIRIHGGDPDSINPGWFFCEDCGKSVEESESGKQEHADFHYAMALDKEEAGLSRVHSNKRDKPSNPSKKRKSRNGTLDGFVVRH